MGYTLVRAGNPGPMTLEGTNTYVLHGSGGDVVVDPGPADEAHLAAVTAATTGPVRAILLTHTHPDHAEAVPELAARTGATVHAADPARAGVPAEPLPVGHRRLAGLDLQVLATPGHTADSVCLVTEDGVLTGDTILGAGSTVVAHPDGDLSAYLRSLRRLAALGEVTALPGHGPQLPSVAVAAAGCLDHRARRLDQVRAALAAGDRTAGDVVRRVYADVDPRLWPAATQSVLAQLAYLREQG